MEKKLENIYCLSCTCRHFFRRPTLSKTHFQLGISLPTKLDRKKSAPRIDRSSSSYTGGGGFAPMKPITYCSQVMHPLKGCDCYLLVTIKKAYHLVKVSKLLFPIGRIFFGHYLLYSFGRQPSSLFFDHTTTSTHLTTINLDKSW